MTNFGWNLEVDIMILMITSFIATRSLVSNNIYSIDRLFRIVIYFDMALAVTDLMWSAIANGIWVVPLWVAYAVNVAYLWVLAMVGFSWFIYSEAIMEMKWTKIGIYFVLFSIPELVLLILLIMSYWTGIIFSVGPDFTYHRGPLLLFATAVDITYPAVTTIRALARSFKNKYYIHRREYRNMASFVLFPTIGAGLLALDPNAPYMASGIMLALVFTFFGREETVIQSDPLTGMPNRRKLYPYVEKIIERHEGFSTKDLYFILIEITNLKEIRSRYGNVEADNAVMMLAEVVESLCEEYSAYGTRYSDNRFGIAFETPEPDEINSLMKKIEMLLAESEEENLQYSIEFKYGYARYDTVIMDSVKSLVEVAENRLRGREYSQDQ
jgi:diguanylate cyclase (GGDEF)-like protein